MEEALDDDEDFDDDTVSRIMSMEDSSVVEHNAMEGYLSLKGNA